MVATQTVSRVPGFVGCPRRGITRYTDTFFRYALYVNCRAGLDFSNVPTVHLHAAQNLGQHLVYWLSAVRFKRDQDAIGQRNGQFQHAFPVSPDVSHLVA